MHLTKASMEDLARIVEVLEDGKNQLAERGVDQWQGEYPNISQVKADIENGFAYLVHRYLTIHRVAIHSAHAGNGYASGLFKDLIDHIKVHREDILSLRIDTHEDNQAMQHLIEKYGFKRVGTLHGVYRPEETSYVYEMLTQQ